MFSLLQFQIIFLADKSGQKNMDGCWGVAELSDDSPRDAKSVYICIGK